MTKRNMRRMLSILLIIAMIVPLVPTGTLAVTNASGEPYGESLIEGYVSDDNGYIKYFVDISTGGFYILPSIQPFDGTKAPSFGSFRLNGEEYVFGGDYPDSSFTVQPFINESGTSQAEWRIGKVYITQFLNIIENDAGNNSYAVYIRYEANTSSLLDPRNSEDASESIDISFEGRILLDTMFGPEDDMPATVSNSSVFLSSETTFGKDNMPEYYGVDSTFTDITPRAYGLIAHETVTSPYAFTLAHFDSVTDTIFDYSPEASLNFTEANSVIGADSAVLLYFEGQSENLSEPLYFSTIYGFDELTYNADKEQNIRPVSKSAVRAMSGSEKMQTELPEFTLGTESDNPTVIGFGGKQWSVIGHNGEGVTGAVYGNDTGAVYNNDTLTLLANERIGNKNSEFGQSHNEYARSWLMGRMEGNGGYNGLIEGEKNLVVPRELDEISGAPVTDAKFWPLSLSEANRLRVAVRAFTYDWWLRLGPPNDGYYVYNILADGSGSSNQNPYNSNNADRPAVILDLPSVLFTSPAVGGKSADAGSDLSTVTLLSPTEALKFTAKTESLTLQVSNLKLSWGGGTNNVSFDYLGATSGTTLSAAILDDEGNMRYYGKLADTIESEGSATLTIPDDSDMTDTLLIFVEQINGDNQTDFCSKPWEIELRPMFTADIGEGFFLEETPEYDENNQLTTFTIKQDPAFIASGNPTRAIKQLKLQDSHGKDIAFTMNSARKVTFDWPLDSVTLELVSTTARRITVPTNANLGFEFKTEIMHAAGVQSEFTFPANAAAPGNEITLYLTAAAGTIPDDTITLVNSDTSQPIANVETLGFVTGVGQERIYTYKFTMPDANISLVFDTREEEVSHYSVVTSVPDSRGTITVWLDGAIVEDGRIEPGKQVTVKISGIDYVHSDFHGVSLSSYMSGIPLPLTPRLDPGPGEKEYFFEMPKQSVIVNLDVRQKPSYSIKADNDINNSMLEITNDRSKIVDKESIIGYEGDTILFHVVNRNIKKMIKQVEILKPEADGGFTNIGEPIVATNPYAERFNGSITMPGHDVVIKVVLEDAPLVLIEVENNLPIGSSIAIKNPAFGGVALGDAISFHFTTTDSRYLIARPVMSVYDKDENLLYENLFDNTKTHSAISPELYTSSVIDKTSGIPAKIVLDVRDRAITYTKVLQSIVPNSSKAELFKTIDVMGRNMYEYDEGDVYIGTSLEQMVPAASYITAYGENKLTITVPDDLLPDEQDITYYVKIHDVVKSCDITFNKLLRKSAYGWLGIVSDANNKHSVIVADNESELVSLKGNRNFAMKINGNVKYNPDNNYYELTDGSALLNNTATFSPAAGKPLRIQQTGEGVTLSASGGKMSVPGYTFVDGEDILAQLDHGIKYSDEWARDEEGNWSVAGVQNIVFEYTTFSLDATLPVINDGLSVEIRNVVLLKDTIIFGGKLSVKLTSIDLEKLSEGSVELSENKFEIDMKRLAFGNNNGNFRLKGVEAVGEITLESLEMPGFGFSGPSGTLSVNTFTNQYALEVSIDIKLVAVEGKLTLEPLNNGWPMIDSFKAAIGSEPGIPILPVAPIGYITNGGAGFSGLVKTINGDFNAIPPVMVSIYGAFDLVKLIEMKDIVINAGPSEISFSAKPKIAKIDVFEKFGGGIFITSKGVRFVVDAQAVILKQFDVIRGGGKIEISYLDSKFSFHGSLFARVQVPEISVAQVWVPTSWRFWEIGNPRYGYYRDINIGPFVLREIGVQINDAGAQAGVKVLGYGIKVEYKWGASAPTFSTYSMRMPDTLETTQQLYDDTGQYMGTANFGGNLSVVATSSPGNSGASLFAMRSLDQITLTYGKILVTEENYRELGMTDEDYAEYLAESPGTEIDDTRSHTLTFPAGIEDDDDDYALVISAPEDDVKITGPGGKAYILKYANGDLNAAGMNAVIFTSPESGEETIMIRLPKESGTWLIESSEPFASTVIAVAPLPVISKATLDNENELKWEAKNLNEQDDYVLEIRMSKDNGADKANADPGTLIDEITIEDRNVERTASGTYILSPEKMAGFSSGDYYPIVTLLSTQEGLYDDQGTLLEEGMLKTPESSVNVGIPYSYINPLQPGDVTTVTAMPGGGGALKATWTAVPEADGYIVSVFDKEGNPIYMETPLYDELGDVVGSQLVHTMYDMPAGDSASTMEANLGGLTPGEEYYVEIMAYVSQENQARIYGRSAQSGTVEIPVPAFPVIFADLPGAEPLFDDGGARIVYVNDSFTFTLSADQACQFTVQSGDQLIYASSHHEQTAQVTVPMGGLLSTNVAITAQNAAGDMSYLSFRVHLDDVSPPLFINTDDDGSIYTDLNGDYVVTGRSEPNATILDDLDNMVKADNNGDFRLLGNLPSGAADTLRSIRAMDYVGNFETADMLIKNFAAVADSLRSISIQPSSEVSIIVGESFPVKTTGELENGNTVNIAPNAVNYHVQEGNTNISINPETGRITALAKGRAAINVSFGNGDSTLSSETLTILINDSDSPATYTVTVDSIGTGATGSGNYVNGATVYINAGTAPANMRFKHWTATPGVVLADANSASTRFTMISQAVTLTAVFETIGGGGSTPSTTETSPTAPPLVMVNGQAVDFTKNKDGSVSLDLTAKNIAQYPVKNHLYVIEIQNQAAIEVRFPITSVLETDVSAVQIKTSEGSVTLTKEMLEAFRKVHGDILELSIRKGSLIVELLKNGTPISYHDPIHPLVISMPAKMAIDTSKAGYVAVKKGSSDDIIMPFSTYQNGEVRFQTSDTGTFDVIYNGRRFNDVTTHWATENITFVAARSIFGGIGNDLFSPDTPMTRAMFAQVLANMEGADLSDYKVSRFNDVAADTWYAPAVEWAADRDIAGGYGKGVFAPEEHISREQMAVMLARYIKYKGYSLPAGQTTAFDDETSIASWAYEAVKSIQAAQIVRGKTGNLYDPQGIASRAEVATIFTNYINVHIGQ